MIKEILRRSCSTCDENKPLEEFYPRSDRPLGREYVCKVCRRASARAYREANPEKARLAKAAAKAKDPERYKALNKASRIRRKKHVADYHWKIWIWKTYRMRPEEYQRMLDAQGGRCAICRNIPEKYRLCVDHDHITEAVRGLLCKSCNSGIGQLRDSQELIQNALAYLQLHAQKSSTTSDEDSQIIQ